MPDQKPIWITRSDPDLKALKKRAKREKDGEMVFRLQAIILTLVFNDISQVLRVMDISRDTLIRWINRFNSGGLEELSKKNDLGVDQH